MIRHLIGASLAAIVGASAATAATTTIDFNGFAPDTDLTGVDLGGVSITSGSAIIETNLVPNNSIGIKTEPFTNLSLFRADFSSLVSAVSVDIGDFGGDEDNLVLEAFDASDALLASMFATLPIGTNAMITLSVSAANISYVLFGSSLTDEFPNSVYADNLVFTTQTAVVPVPASLVLMMSALASLAAVRKRRVG